MLKTKGLERHKVNKASQASKGQKAITKNKLKPGMVPSNKNKQIPSTSRTKTY